GEIMVKQLPFSTSICVRTLYNYIDKGVFLNLTNKNLPIKGNRKRTYRHIRQARPSKGDSIEKRPSIVDKRNSFGYWEMDTVVGKQGTKKILLVLTERLTRNEIIIPLKDKTARSVVVALNSLERRYGAMFYKMFHTITVDNGCEFTDCAGMEKSCLRKGKRTKLYYCHPYSSWERGSNENQNKMIRRYFPKGFDFSNTTKSEVKQVEEWMNNYPRAKLGYHSSSELFLKCLSAL
ncbi:MAG: IS30 family transposase, partial [Clostridiales bacterium]|nr:IS30 family transposase [Clostridiales bacterium]